MVKLLLVEDEPVTRLTLEQYFTSQGYQVTEAASCAEAREHFAAARPDVVLSDFELPDGDALDLLRFFQDADPDLPVIVLTAYGTIERAVEAMRQGADHFFTKPVDLKSLGAILERSLEERRGRRQLRARRSGRRLAPDPFCGTSDLIRRLGEMARRVADADRPALLLGETGSGKGILARWLHDHSPRADEPFVDLNCAGLALELLESELFGHRKGAFTGASDSKQGMLEVADRGTLFLDEIGDLPLTTQPKLLKVLEEQRFRRLGEVRDRQVDLRLVAATHQDLERRLAEGQFRQDLFFRINALPLVLPPLRQRREDILPLALFILEDLGRELGHPGLELAPAAETALCDYDWPGNIRELRNVLERAVLLGGGPVLEPGDLRFEITPGAAAAAGGAAAAANPGAASPRMEDLERQHIEEVLAAEGGSVTRASQVLGIPRSTLYRKLKRYGIEP